MRKSPRSLKQNKLPLRPADGGPPDLQEWIAFYGGYHNIPAEAWAEWDRLHVALRERQQL
jgi:hypothetical protein